MNQNDRNDGHGAGFGQPYSAGNFNGSGAWPAYSGQQGYSQAQPGYQQPQQGYSQGQQPGYQAPAGYQINIGRNPGEQGYQPQGYQGQGYQGQGYQAQGYQPQQGTGSQPTAAGYQSGYQNPYAAQTPAQGQTGYYNAGGYPQANGYPAGGQGNAAQGYPQGGSAPSAGSYIPQTPYSQGYASPGYSAPNGYNQNYNAYTQMGRAQQPAYNQPQQEPGRQIPLNGSGYVPQPVPVRRRPFEMKDSYLLVLSGVLLVLFAAGMFLNGGVAILKWIFLALAAGSIALLWIKPMVDGNKRLCYSIVFGLLALVTVISMITARGGNGDSTQAIQGGNDPNRVTSSTSQEDIYGTGSAVAPVTASVTNTPEPEPDNSVTERLQTFFYYWSANRYDDMLTLCSPTWQSKTENPKTALFALMANRTPKDYMVENVSGTDQDTSRAVTVTSLMDRNNGKDPVKYRLSVIMMKENDSQWYVDPQSLQTYEAAETTDPSITPTPAPTETPAVYSNTTLYYNPSGGEYYHLDQNCKRINERYLPLKGHFTYAELGNEPYNKLKPCAICGAPSAP